MAEQEELLVEGMTCANCAMGVRKRLEKIGLEEVDVNFSTGEVHFTNTPKLETEKISKEVEDLGYSIKTESQDGSSKSQTLSRIEKKFYFCLVFTVPLFAHMFLPLAFLHNPVVQLILSIPVIAVGFAHFGRSAFHSLKNGVPNMDVLIFIGSMSAFVYSLAGTIQYWGSIESANYLFYETAATIITLVLLGNVLEHRSVKQTTTAISELNKLQVETTTLVIQEGQEEKLEEVNVEVLRISDLVQLKEGDRIPTDGKLQIGEVYVNEAMITGEAESVLKKKGDKLIGGTIIEEGNGRMMVTAIGKETTLSKIINLVKKAQTEKPDIQRLGDQVSAVFVPVVVGIALLTFLIWYFAVGAALSNSLMTAIAVLVISCPCAMGLATPTAVMVGVGRAAKQGILIKGGATVEVFAKLKNIVFDKTGTLTTGAFQLQRIELLGDKMDEETVKRLVYSLEQYSSHPIAQSLLKQLKSEGVKSLPLLDQKEIKGKGIQAKDMNGNAYQLGSAKWLGADGSAKLYLTKNEQLVAGIFLDDQLRSDAPQMVKAFKKLGISTYVLSGDKEEKTKEIAQATAIDHYYAEQLPDEKLAQIEKIQTKGLTGMVGDGINDAPALSKADVGVSLSGATQIAIQSAQVILLNTKSLSSVFKAFQISHHTLLTIKQNLFWALAYNVVAIPLAAFGYLDPMLAALSMAFSDVIVIGNSIRLKHKKID
ncbi:MAG: cation-translocating P-type ATPase [Vicingaceae bacterium]